MRKIQQTILRCASLFVPGEARSEWLAEWRAELWHLRRKQSPSATAFCFGAFQDAFWLRRNTPRYSPVFRMESPFQCIAVLAAIAAVTVFFALRSPAQAELCARAGQTSGHPVWGTLALIAVALIVLRGASPLGLGEYPAGRCAPPRPMRFRRWILFAAKIALLIPIVFCGILDLAKLLSASQIQPHGLLIGYVLAFRWALKDQRRRCPVCLRLLSRPTRIGMASQTFLEWYGTELICERGHGLLYVPEIPSSCYTTQRWMYLDASWSGLFSQAEGVRSR